MKGKAVIPLVAGLCIGGFALKIGLDTLKRAKGAQQVTMTELWSVKTDIPRGTQISEEMLKPMPFPAKYVPPGAVTDKAKLVGRVPRLDAPANVPILEDMLQKPGTPAGLHVKSGFRAAAVKIDESSGVDNHLQPGCRVDVIGYFTDTRSGKQVTIARTIIENVEVAAVGTRLSNVGEPGEKPEKAQSSANNKPARAVTLFVRPEDVPPLHLAEQRGKIKLSMRNDEDSGVIDRSRITSEREVLGTKDPEEPKDPGGKSSLAGQFAKLFGKSKPDAPPAAQPPPQPAPPLPKLAVVGWEVVVRSGALREIVRFKDQNSRERIVDPDEESAPKKSAPAPRDKHAPPGMPPAPGPAPSDTPSQTEDSPPPVSQESPE